MFSKLKELVDSFEVPLKNYRVAKENREILQMIKVEAQRLRQEISKVVKSKAYTKE